MFNYPFADDPDITPVIVGDDPNSLGPVEATTSPKWPLIIAFVAVSALLGFVAYRAKSQGMAPNPRRRSAKGKFLRPRQLTKAQVEKLFRKQLKNRPIPKFMRKKEWLKFLKELQDNGKVKGSSSRKWTLPAIVKYTETHLASRRPGETRYAFRKRVPRSRRRRAGR